MVVPDGCPPWGQVKVCLVLPWLLWAHTSMPTPAEWQECLGSTSPQELLLPRGSLRPSFYFFWESLGPSQDQSSTASCTSAPSLPPWPIFWLSGFRHFPTSHPGIFVLNKMKVILRQEQLVIGHNKQAIHCSSVSFRSITCSEASLNRIFPSWSVSWVEAEEF